MNIDRSTLSSEIVYAAILETLGKLLREHARQAPLGLDHGTFERVHDAIAEAIERILGEGRQRPAEALGRIAAETCSGTAAPKLAVWMLHEAIARETLTGRALEEIAAAGEEGAWDCVPARAVLKARRILQAAAGQRRAEEGRVCADRASAVSQLSLFGDVAKAA